MWIEIEVDADGQGVRVSARGASGRTSAETDEATVPWRRDDREEG
ncbi:hypothetical protein [Sorangium cellulosum]|nr:hypothetical protein [Sorangium cellulosum]